MKRFRFTLAAVIGLAALAGGASHAAATAQAVSSAQLRATGQVGEQWNGYLAIVGAATPALQSHVNAVNIRRRAAYTNLAARRGVQVQEVGATMACEILATSILPGQYYRLRDGVWRRREGNAPVARPDYCV